MIKFAPFGGLFPLIGKRLLPPTAAQRAINIKLQSGELRPLREPGLSYVPLTPKTNPALSIFKARNGTSSSDWFSWPVDVDCVRAPLPTDVTSRFCWTGDGVPKMAVYTSAVVGSTNNFPLAASEFTLGVPTPQTAPTVTPSGGVATDVTRFYCYTFETALGEESSPSPLSLSATGKPDGTWAIAAMDTAPANSGVGTAAFSSVTTFTATAAAKHWLRVGDSVVLSNASPTVLGTFTVASVPSASTFTVAGNYATAVSWSRSTPWNISGMTKNLYRTTGTTGVFQLINATGVAVATTTYSDTLSDSLIAGDDLVSVGWVPPPVGLTGLCVHSSGALVGFVNNLLCFSEPTQPHAWPTAYQLSSGFNGVGLATSGSTIIMATAGTPFVVTGTEPLSMSGENVPGMYPCLSKRSVISYAGGVLYASKHGLISAGPSGAALFTKPFYTRDEWDDLNPSTMVCATANERMYVAYDNDAGTKKILIFDGELHTTADVSAYELYTDEATGELYLTTSEGILLWDDPDKVVLFSDWMSKEFVFPAPVNLGAAKVDFDLVIDPAQQAAIDAAQAVVVAANAALIAASPQAVKGSINASIVSAYPINGSAMVAYPENAVTNEVTFNLYSDDTLLATRTVSNNTAFRLPAGYKRDVFHIEVLAQCNIKEVRIAETMIGLKDG